MQNINNLIDAINCYTSLKQKLSKLWEKRYNDLLYNYKQWNNAQVIEWLRTIDVNEYEQEEWSSLIQTFSQLNINGQQLNEITNLMLTIEGIKSPKIRDILWKHLNELKMIENEQSISDDDKETNQCVICYDKEVSILVRPCNHLCCCESCKNLLEQNGTKTCPYCGLPAQMFEKTCNDNE